MAQDTSLSGQRVLVTGGAGYIGTELSYLLVERGYHPVVLDTFNWGRAQFEPLAGKVTLLEGDVRSGRDLAYALQDIDGGVIHLAGIVGEPACKINPVASETINVESTHTLVNAMTNPRLHPVRNLVYCSSCSVYGNVAGMYEQVDERTPTMPLSEYAAAKLEAERILFARAAENPYFDPAVIRLTTIFGWSRKPRVDLVTNLFALKAVRGEPIELFGGGTQFRSLIHVADVARALVTALEAPRYLTRGEVFHVGEEANNVTLKALAEKVRAVVPQAEIRVHQGGPADRRDYRINCQKIKNALNWRAERSVDDGVRELVEMFRSTDLDLDAAQYRNDRYNYH